MTGPCEAPNCNVVEVNKAVFGVKRTDKISSCIEESSTQVNKTPEYRAYTSPMSHTHPALAGDGGTLFTLPVYPILLAYWSIGVARCSAVPTDELTFALPQCPDRHSAMRQARPMRFGPRKGRSVGNLIF